MKRPRPEDAEGDESFDFEPADGSQPFNFESADYAYDSEAESQTDLESTPPASPQAQNQSFSFSGSGFWLGDTFVLLTTQIESVLGPRLEPFRGRTGGIGEETILSSLGYDDNDSPRYGEDAEDAVAESPRRVWYGEDAVTESPRRGGFSEDAVAESPRRGGYGDSQDTRTRDSSADAGVAVELAEDPDEVPEEEAAELDDDDITAIAQDILGEAVKKVHDQVIGEVTGDDTGIAPENLNLYLELDEDLEGRRSDALEQLKVALARLWMVSRDTSNTGSENG